MREDEHPRRCNLCRGDEVASTRRGRDGQVRTGVVEYIWLNGNGQQSYINVRWDGSQRVYAVLRENLIRTANND